MDSILKLIGSCLCYEHVFSRYTVPEVTINGEKYIVNELIAEDNDCYKYTITSQSSLNSARANPSSGSDNNGNKYILKRVNCFTMEDLKIALTEINYYNTFDCKYIMKLVDSQILQQYNGLIHGVPEISNGSSLTLGSSYSSTSTNNISKVCNIVFPYFPLGTIDDLMNKSIINNDFVLNENEIIEILLGVARALQYLHNPELRNESHHIEPSNNINTTVNDTYKTTTPILKSDTPLEHILNESETVSSGSNFNNNVYIGMNLSPFNIFIQKNQQNDNEEYEFTPVIGDLSCCIKSSEICNSIQFKEWLDRIGHVEYKAPELIQKNIEVISTKSDIWSFGCLTYALIYGTSPFKREEELRGSSLSYSVNIGKFSFPEKAEKYTDTAFTKLNELNELITKCLKVDPNQRLDTTSVIEFITTL
ncbi:hypothetical protein TPHA_0H01880 [Tetrapisispora phaffii CBS 4417]|uniref:non-specific serine/threonine protein kinase n=1 Tax=Tetrapisispora phaffii (strain ATCC 24235 / CBS 4417 / NBRC 1672 / NRRL Y-8282 / UCD 70-5) TaxID=1071381 RepID=G8BWE2_TETPH|nr:hypothetical protein TPHA_0H01880 [Tetrapisispora phaffii CBS 4417]CCE64393.1 hypothetical protein TPHA_0H01880 [Tetrapisispora phaffii CBS 4417]